ncbi:hypothetical protein [Salipiger abyssi]|uniref:hypothetical protein n=1 Tax=Salipiger abyssi TaxID=1250539 RepID=UPI004059D08D
MANRKIPQPESTDDDRDPYAVRSIEHLLTLFDGGHFLTELMPEHRELLQKMQDHNEEFGHKGAKGSFTLSVSYELGGAGDLGMQVAKDFKGPKRPPSHAHAFVDRQGQLTLYSPMMKRMHSGVRDVTPHDPETGEVRDVD